MGNSFNKNKCGANLRQAITRINIHRQKKLNLIAKNKDTICKHLSAQNEINAKIWCETLINDENQIPVFDITSTMCDQIKGRLEYMSKFGAPQDMTQTFATVIHVAPKLEVEELMKVRNHLAALLGKEFVIQADEDKSCLNPVVAENIDFKNPETGEVIYKLRLLAKERNISYEPSYEMRIALNNYLDRKGLPDPLDQNYKPMEMPVYRPQIPPGDGSSNIPPPFNGGGGGDLSHPPSGNFGIHANQNGNFQFQGNFQHNPNPSQQLQYSEYDPNSANIHPPVNHFPGQQYPSMLPNEQQNNNQKMNNNEYQGESLADLEARLNALDRL